MNKNGCRECLIERLLRRNWRPSKKKEDWKKKNKEKKPRQKQEKLEKSIMNLLNNKMLKSQKYNK